MVRLLGYRRGGFPLIEFLVVIAIIALLAAMLLPALARAKEYAYFAACKNNLRQVGLGVTLFANDHDEAFPEGENRCSGGPWFEGRRIGSCSWRWIYGSGENSVFLEKVYDDHQPGVRWDGSVATNWRGRPRLKGKYLPVEILWDPITKVRNWGPWGMNSPLMEVFWGKVETLYAGKEAHRDTLARRFGVLGYAFFIGSVGCHYYTATGNGGHVLSGFGGTGVWWNSEQPFRPATRNTSMTATALPSSWMAACLTPRGAFGGLERHFISHFACSWATPGLWKSNVLRMDGSVRQLVWREIQASGQWLMSFDSSRPYGWRWKSDRNQGVEVNPFIGGAVFDR